MKPVTIDYIKECLVSSRFFEQDSPLELELLEGGVSCSVWKISTPKGQWVFKQALPKLSVEADWYSDIERIHREHAVMRELSRLLPKGAVPKVSFADEGKHFYLMNYIASKGTWKDALMQEDFDAGIARQVGNLLKNIHEKSNRINSEQREQFCDQKYFIQLRIEPFHKYLLQKYPQLIPAVENLIDELTMRKTCLVHGDFSPKNILIDKQGKVVLLDFEVAHWGNPVFDLAYCIGHLMLKGWHLDKTENSLQLIEAFLQGYDRKTDPLIPHLGLMLLARVDGKSPVSYIKDEALKNKIRTVAIEWINSNADTTVLPGIQKALLS